MRNFDIVSFGEILIDFTSIKSNTDKKVFEQNPGGAPANVLVAATKLGACTAFIGKAGNDMHGIFLKDTLIKENINIDNFILDNEFFTTLAFVDLDMNNERTFSFARKPGADTQMRIDELNEDIIINSKMFHVGSLSLTNNPSRETTLYAIDLARNNNVLISYDPNYRESLWSNKEEAIKQMKSITPDIFKISDEEIELITGENNYVEAAQVLLKRGSSIVVVTLGADGCYILSNKGAVLVPGYKTVITDTTGAGDSFYGAFLSRLCKQENLNDISIDELKEYGKFSNATASICVEQTGAIPAMPSLEQVLNRIK